MELARLGADPILWGIALEQRIGLTLPQLLQMPVRVILQARAIGRVMRRVDKMQADEARMKQLEAQYGGR